MVYVQDPFKHLFHESRYPCFRARDLWNISQTVVMGPVLSDVYLCHIAHLNRDAICECRISDARKKYYLNQ